MQNNDLISRSALRESMCGELKRLADIAYFKLRNDADRMERAIRAVIDVAPAVDAEPVRHGWWINKTKPIYAAFDYRFDCSVCKHIFYAGGIERFRYCPWCGAKMDAAVGDISNE